MDGVGIHKILRDLARSSPSSAAIVEVGTWLAAGTAHLAIGAIEREDPVPIHSYDRFLASESEAKKAAEAGFDVKADSDTLPLVAELMSQFDTEIHLHKADLYRVRWNGPKIGLYVDDAAKSPSAFFKVLATFAPYWIPGETVVVLQDFHFWKRISKQRSKRRYRVQNDFIERHQDCFTAIEMPGLEGSTTAVFRYERRLPIASIRAQSALRNGFRRLLPPYHT